MKKNKELYKWILSSIKPSLLSISIITALGIMMSLLGVFIAITSKHLIDSAVSAEKQFVFSLSVFLIIILLLVSLQVITSIYTNRNSELISNRIRLVLFSRVLKTKWMELSVYHSDDILTRLTSDISVFINGFINVIPDIITFCFQIIAAFTALLLLEPRLALIALVLGPVAVITSRLIGKRLKDYHTKIQEAEGLYRGFIHEAIINFVVLKVFSYEEPGNERLDKLQKEKLFWVLRRNRLGAYSNGFLSVGYWFGFLLAFTWGAVSLKEGSTSFGTMAAFIQLIEQLQSPFIGLSHTLPQLASAYASAVRLMELEKLNLEENSDNESCLKKAGIRFENVGFYYSKDKPVIRNAEINIAPGERIGLKGASGEGKTTIVRMLLSLIEPQYGNIYFNDGCGREYPLSISFRKSVSYVPQGATLFSGSIADNLRIGNINASEDQLRQALAASMALEFVTNLPGGLNFCIGEAGVGLSEGQAQRIAIARGLLREAPVLVLDEATAQIDEDNEEQIIKNIFGLKPLCTIIIITHSQKVLKKCNRVLELKNGCITG